MKALKLLARVILLFIVEAIFLGLSYAPLHLWWATVSAYRHVIDGMEALAMLSLAIALGGFFLSVALTYLAEFCDDISAMWRVVLGR